MSKTRDIRLVVNGEHHLARSVPVRKLLTDFLRDDLELTGTHVGCEHGVCGACTVLLNGELVRACLLFAAQLDGSEIETIEGLASGVDDLHPIQQAFWDQHGSQCGFCTPGMVLATKVLLEDNPRPTDEEVREALSGNICRCTGYVFIIAAVQQAAEHLARQRLERESDA